MRSAVIFSSAVTSTLAAATSPDLAAPSPRAKCVTATEFGGPPTTLSAAAALPARRLPPEAYTTLFRSHLGRGNITGPRRAQPPREVRHRHRVRRPVHHLECRRALPVVPF